MSRTQSTASTSVTPPTGAPPGGWDRFELEICTGGSCWTQDCTGAPQPYPSTTACDFGGLSPSTSYTVAATAVKGGTRSPQSAPAPFTTRAIPQE